jgi:hypothetical protein
VRQENEGQENDKKDRTPDESAFIFLSSIFLFFGLTIA